MHACQRHPGNQTNATPQMRFPLGSTLGPLQSDDHLALVNFIIADSSFNCTIFCRNDLAFYASPGGAASPALSLSGVSSRSHHWQILPFSCALIRQQRVEPPALLQRLQELLYLQIPAQAVAFVEARVQFKQDSAEGALQQKNCLLPVFTHQENKKRSSAARFAFWKN